MSTDDDASARRDGPDPMLVAIADCVMGDQTVGEVDYGAARDWLMDALARGLQALKVPGCRALIGPVVPGATMMGGARVPGTSHELDPVQAAFNIGVMVGWPDVHGARAVAEEEPRVKLLACHVTFEAAHNLVLIYRNSGATSLALDVMLKHLRFA